MKIISSILLISICLVSFPLWADNEGEKTVSGTVVDLDWVNSTITVLYSDPYSGQSDEINIKIDSSTVMHRGTESISFSDILQSDQVTVTFYDDGVGGFKAKRLSDLNLSAITN